MGSKRTESGGYENCRQRVKKIGTGVARTSSVGNIAILANTIQYLFHNVRSFSVPGGEQALPCADLWAGIRNDRTILLLEVGRSLCLRLTGPYCQFPESVFTGKK